MTQPKKNDLSTDNNGRTNRLDTSIPRFLDQVSHDFRTPLTVIKEFATLMRDGLAGEVNSSQREYLDVINDRADDLTLIVDNLLDAGKQSSGTLRAWRRGTNVGELIGGMQTMLAHKAALRRIKFDAALENDLPDVYADREQLVRALTNMVVGAMRSFEQTESVQIRVGRGSGVDQVELEITATGQRCITHVLDIMDQAFDRTRAFSEKCSNDCMGLHFAVTGQLVDLHFGRINLEHPTDNKVIIRVSLPVNHPTSIFDAYLRHLRTRDDVLPEAELIAASIGPDVQPSAAGVVDEFLQSSVGTNDLVVRTDEYHWLILVLDAGDPQEKVIGRINAIWSEMRDDLHGNLLPSIEWTNQGRWNLASDTTALAEQFDAETVCASV